MIVTRAGSVNWWRYLPPVAAVGIVVWSLGPFVWQLSTSLQLDKELISEVPSFVPAPPTIAHYLNIFTEKSFQLYIANSAIVAGATTLICLIAGALAAYVLSRGLVRGRYNLLGFILGVSMFPQIAIVAPLYLLAADIGLLDTHAILIIVYTALNLPLVIWVLYGYFNGISREIDEAARIDGAGTMVLLFRIIVPISVPGVVTVGLLCFIAAWNEFMFALAFTSDVATQTIPVGIANFTDLYYAPWGDIAAASIVVTVPLVVLVMIFERRIVEGLTHGAIK
jgi:multiple sugar transport system permease protein